LQNGNLFLKIVQIPIEEDGGVYEGANNSIACQGTVVVRLRAWRLQRKISIFQTLGRTTIFNNRTVVKNFKNKLLKE